MISMAMVYEQLHMSIIHLK